MSTKRVFGLAVLSLGLLSTISIFDVAFAGDVDGTVRVELAAPDLEGPVGYWNVWNGFVPPANARTRLSREVTVVLRGEGSGEPSGCSYRIFGGDLMPQTFVARAGSEIRIDNRDAMSHELEIEGLEGAVATATAPGNSRPITAPAGSYAISDLAFEHVGGHLVAINDLVACGELGDDGKFTFADVAPGTYQLTVYRDGEAVHEAPITVEDDLTVETITLN